MTEAVGNLTEHSNGLVQYMNDSILPEFEAFVDAEVRTGEGNPH